MNKHIIILGLLVIGLVSCKTEYPEYTKTENGLPYKLHKLGDGDRKPNIGDFVIVNMILRSLHDGEVIQVDSSKVIRMDNPSDGDIQEGLSMLVAGDSATFLVKRPAKWNPDSIQSYNLDIEVLNILDENEYEKEKKYIEWRADQEMNELIALKKYLSKIGKEESSNYDGVYFESYDKGIGNNVVSGDYVTIHYKGYFIDGRMFDSTYENDTPLEFNFGDPDQVIRGFEIALSQMNKKSKAKIIIPSQLAFGESGSSTGIVPPFSTLIYDIEVVKKVSINKKVED
jgi:FKBP-type peptidyl-prolyl cis-trans isomerase